MKIKNKMALKATVLKFIKSLLYKMKVVQAKSKYLLFNIYLPDSILFVLSEDLYSGMFL